MNANTINNILENEKGRTAQAQQIFAEYANELNITEFSKAECAMLRAWFKAVVPEIDAFFRTKAGNDALCHGLKNLQKGVAAKSSATTGHEETDNNNYKGEKEAEQKAEKEAEKEAEQKAEKEAEQKAEKEAEQEAEKEAEQEAEQKAEQEAEQKAEKEAEQEAEQKAEKEAEQEAEQKAEKKAEEEAEQKAEKEAEQEAEQKAEKEAEQEAEQKAEKGAEEEEESEEAQQQVTRSPEELTTTERECYELIQADLIPYLYGPAGTGKTTAAEHIAEALGLKFYFTPSVFEKFDLTGFVDGNGTLIDTPFIQALLNGGLFLFDEWDVSDPQAIKFFNMVLSQRMFVIPKYGIVRAHRDFKIMAAGNTRGTGATSNYPTALTQDASCRNRFIPIYYDYNREIENMLAEDDGELIEFVHDLRNAIKESGLDTVISYRNIINCKRMQKMPYYSTNEALIIKRCFAGDFDADNFDMVVSNMTTTHFNKYTALFNGLNIQ